MNLRLVLFASSILFTACFGGAGSQRGCDITNCVGCCDTAGVCQLGTTATACGANAAQCIACGASQTCTNGQCIAGGTAGGSGSTAGGSGSTAGGDGAAGGSGMTAGGSGMTAGGTGMTAGGTGMTAGGSGMTAGGSGMAAGGTGMTAGGTGNTAGGSGMTAGGAGTAGGAVLRNVTGTRVHTFVTDVGMQTYPDPMSSGVRAQFESGGTFTTYPGTVNSPGNFTLPVPNGPYLLDLTSSSIRFLVLTNASTLDLAQNYSGRYNVSYPNATTPLQINVTGLLPWDPTDDLCLTSTNNGLASDDVAATATASTLDAGSTAGSITIDYRLLQQPLVSAALGDTVVLTQNGVIGSPVPHVACVASATVTGLTQTSGVASSINAAFTTGTPTSRQLDVRLSQFEAYRADVHPQAVAVRTQLLVYGMPGLTNARSVVGGTAYLLYVPVAAGSGDLNGTFNFLNPFPASVPLAFDSDTLFGVNVQAAGAASTTFYGIIGTTTPLASLSGGLTPRISPPRNVQVNGMGATVPLSGVGMTPTLTWAAPSLGTADRYIVAVARLVNQGGQTRLSYSASLRLKGTRLVLPPGVLTAGGQHLIIVAAEAHGGIDVETQPFANGGITGRADAVIGPITP